MYNPRQYHKWLHSWWCFRAQTSALQQATPFLGATNRDATTVPPMAIRRNTSTLNDTFTGDRRFPSSRRFLGRSKGKDIARTCDNEWSHGTAAPVLSALRLTDFAYIVDVPKLLKWVEEKPTYPAQETRKAKLRKLIST